MNRPHKFLATVVSLFLLYPAIAAGNADQNTDDSRTVTLLFTNDVESAYDPISAFWIDGMARIGGIAEMTTLIREQRATETNVFLFDAGDIFTGTTFFYWRSLERHLRRDPTILNLLNHSLPRQK